MSIIIKNLGMPIGCQKCKFFCKHMFGNGLDYSYSCVLGAKDFPMPWIRQMEERASDCPIEPLVQEPVLDKIRTEICWKYRVILEGTSKDDWAVRWNDCLDEVLQLIDKYKSEMESEE